MRVFFVFCLFNGRGWMDGWNVLFTFLEISGRLIYRNVCTYIYIYTSCPFLFLFNTTNAGLRIPPKHQEWWGEGMGWDLVTI